MPKSMKELLVVCPGRIQTGLSKATVRSHMAIIDSCRLTHEIHLVSGSSDLAVLTCYSHDHVNAKESVWLFITSKFNTMILSVISYKRTKCRSVNHFLVYTRG